MFRGKLAPRKWPCTLVFRMKLIMIPHSPSSSSSSSFSAGSGTTALVPREAAAKTSPDAPAESSTFWTGPGTTTLTPGGEECVTTADGTEECWVVSGGNTTITPGKQ